MDSVRSRLLLLVATAAACALLACGESGGSQEVGRLTVELEPVDAPARTRSTLFARADQPHPTGSVPVFTWSWEVDGTDAGVSVPTVTRDLTTKGELWSATGSSVVDGQSRGPHTTPEVRILNSVPVVDPRYGATNNRVIPANCDLAVQACGFDDDGDPITFVVQWLRMPPMSPEAPIPGFDGVVDAFVLPQSEYVQGDTLRIRITPSDPEQSGAPTGVPNVQSENLSSTVLVGAPTTGQCPATPAPTGDLTVTLEGMGSGTISSFPSEDVLAGATFDCGTPLLLTATPDVDSVFGGWETENFFGVRQPLSDSQEFTIRITPGIDRELFAIFDPAPAP